jgi:hypothetical protein
LGSALLLSALLSIWVADGFAAGGGTGGGTGGGGGGGGVKAVTPPAPTAPAPSILPTTAPAPDVIMRESFGFADAMRPAGGKGVAKTYVIATPISGFWIEYPGSNATAWLAPAEPAITWRVCGESIDPYEMPSPLEVNSNGCLFSNETGPGLDHPTALMPFTAPATPYQISIDAWAIPNPADPAAYFGFGLTTSSILDSNLETSASVWLELVRSTDMLSQTYTLRVDGRTGSVLASGTMDFDPFTRLVLRDYPAAGTVSASVNEVELGVFSLAIKSPRFIGLEGVGYVNNFVVRNLP